MADVLPYGTYAPHRAPQKARPTCYDLDNTTLEAIPNPIDRSLHPAEPRTRLHPALVMVCPAHIAYGHAPYNGHVVLHICSRSWSCARHTPVPQPARLWPRRRTVAHSQQSPPVYGPRHRPAESFMPAAARLSLSAAVPKCPLPCLAHVRAPRAPFALRLQHLRARGAQSAISNHALSVAIQSSESVTESGHRIHESAVGESGCTRNACSYVSGGSSRKAACTR